MYLYFHIDTKQIKHDKTDENVVCEHNVSFPLDGCFLMKSELYKTFIIGIYVWNGLNQSHLYPAPSRIYCSNGVLF